MKLLRFKYKNIFSLGEGEINLLSRGLTLITGFSEDEGSSNGAGKSSLANKGILWTLFGETAGGLKADAVLNRHTKNKCFGEIELEGKDGNIYRILRERPAKLSLFKGDKEVTAHTAKDTQKIIEGVLGFDHSTFVQTSVFGQGRNIHYPSLPPKEQKAVLEQILPMEEVDRWAVIADTEIKALVPKRDEVSNKHKTAEGRYSTLKHQLEQAHKDGESFEQKRLSRKEEAQKELKQITLLFEQKKLELEKKNQQYQTFDIQELNDIIVKDIEQIGKLKEKLEPILDKLKQANTSELKWTTNLHFLQRQMNELNTDTKCPVCLRDYDNSTKQAVTKKVNDQKQLISDCYENIKKCKEAIEYFTKEKENLEITIYFHDTNKAKYEKIIQGYASYNQELKDLENYKETQEASPKATLALIDTEENPHIATVQRIELEIKEEEKTLEDLTKQQQQFNDELEHLYHWRNVYGKELKLKLFEDACPFLDTRTTYHLERLRNKQIHCDFSTVKRLSTGAVKEDFNVNVWSETGGRGFESLSGGEQQVVSFAISLALADLAASINGAKSSFLILDEPFTELDSRNGEAVVEYLISEVENGIDTVFLISNDEALKGLIQNRIYVIKSHGVTNVQ